MSEELELRDLLTRELRRVPAPAGLWAGVETQLDSPPSKGREFWPVWAMAAALSLLVLGISVKSARGRQELDLGSYLAPVQAVSPYATDSALAQAPPHFVNVSDHGGLDPMAKYRVAGYRVEAQRVTRVGGETVRQVILTTAEGVFALFISSPRVRLDAGADRWVDGSVEGVACKRLNCPRVRSAQFPCLQQTCVLICKACSDHALSALMTQVAELQ